MIKEIKYNGYSATPSDYECPDGDLASAINIIPEDGALKPIAPPHILRQFEENQKILYIHKGIGFSNYIIAQVNSTGVDLYFSADIDGDITFIDHLPTIVAIEAIGNTLVVSCHDLAGENNGIHYLLWKDNSYLLLGNKPPFVSIEFALSQIYTARATHSDSFDVDSDDASKVDEWINGNGSGTAPVRPGGRTLAGIDYLTDAISNAIYGQLLSFASDEITEKGYFYQPFFVRYAFRLFDGSYSWHSAPVLMIPISTAPIIRLYSRSFSDNILSTTSEVQTPFAKLSHRILSVDQDKLALWTDIISGIEIFVSAPIYTYDQSKNIETAILGSAFDGGFSHMSDTSRVVYSEETLFTESDALYWELPTRDKEAVEEDISSCALFYHVASIQLDKIAKSDTFTDTPIKKDALKALVNREILPDDYLSHHLIEASDIQTYNNRLNLSNIRLHFYDGFPIRTMVAYRNPTSQDNYSGMQLPAIVIKLNKNGDSILGVAQNNRDGYTAISENSVETSPYLIDAINDSFPRYLFYPDPDAIEMKISTLYNVGSAQMRCYTVPLKRHPTLNGAYYFRGFGDDLPSYEVLSSPYFPAYGTSYFDMSNKIYTSEVNNPFYFPLLGINSVGTGSILGICAAVKALSQGQFGQFPLYAFTTEGIWALEVSDTGTYSAKQPVSRDVCINTDSITQLDSAVLFATDRGIMHISGSTVQCISDNLNTEDLFSIADLPKCDKLIDIFNAKADDAQQITIADVAILPFLDFLADCRMIYDYTNQRIIVYNPAVRYAYIYSMKSKTWGMMRSAIVDNVNSYPEALAMAAGATLVDFSKSDAETTTSLIITRPFKIDSPDTFKTINTIIQRGMFRSTHVRQVLYGSNDLFNWHTVWSSVDKIMRGFRGSPYKAYRLALVCRFDKAESIYGCTVVYQPRLTNQVR